MLKMSETCPICDAVLDQVEYDCQAHGNHWVSLPPIFFHATPMPEACEHDFQSLPRTCSGGWRDFPDGNGGEQFCVKCGLGAMADSLRVGL